jgi:DNA-binding NtrC family response regulator
MAEAKILIVDDEQEYLDILSERMEGRDFEVDKAGNGMEALDRLSESTYDAIVMDMMMPGMDGLETLKRIREKHPDMQVILLTGHATVQKGVDAIKMGALDFLEKPAEIETLTAKIKEAKDNRLLLVEKHNEEAVKEALRKFGM